MYWTSVAMGAMFIVVSLISLRSRKRIQTQGLPVTATVLASARQRKQGQQGLISRGKAYAYFSVMEYTVEGKTYQSRSDVGHPEQKYRDGEQVEILCDPKAPVHFMVVGEKQPTQIYTAFFAIGAALLVIGLVLMFTEGLV